MPGDFYILRYLGRPLSYTDERPFIVVILINLKPAGSFSKFIVSA